MENLYLYLGLYFLTLIGIGFYISKKETPEDFLIGGRNRKGWQILLSKFAGAIGAGWFVTYTAYAYEFGFGVFMAILGFMFGYFLFAYWAVPIIYKHSKEKKFYTQGDFVFSKTNNTFSKLLTNLVASSIQFGWLLIGVIGGSKIISHFGFLSYELAIFLTVGIVLIYILLAGFKAVIITDVFQSVIILLLLVFLSFNIIGETNITNILSTQTGNIDIGTAIGFLLYGILSVFALSDRYQLCYSAKNEKNLKRGIGFAIIPIILVASFLLIIGIYMYIQNPNLDSGLVFLEALKNYLPVSLLPIAIVMFFAGLMSSVDTAIFSITSHYVFSKKEKRQPIKNIRIFTIILLIITSIFAYYYRNIVGITIIAAALTVSLSVPMIYILLGNINKNRFIGSVFGSITGLVLGIVILGVKPTIILLVIIGGCLGLLYKKNYFSTNAHYRLQKN